MQDADVTALLRAWGEGDLAARDQLMPLVYNELRRRAAACLRGERRGNSLEPTGLVHEAYLRLVNQRCSGWQNRAHFLAIAAQMMRRVIVDHARAGRMAKRSGRWVKVSLDEDIAGRETPNIDAIALDNALAQLARFDGRKSQVAELRFFGGLSLEETGHVLSISVATVEREWRAARAWLYAALTTGNPP